MNSQIKFKQASSRILNSSRQKINHRSLSYIGRSKIQSSQNKHSKLNTQSQQQKKIRLKTQYKQIKKQGYDQYTKQKVYSFLNSQQLSKLKLAKKRRYNNEIQDDNNIILTQTQNTLTVDSKVDNKICNKIDNKVDKDNQWVNSALPMLSAQALYEQNHQLKRQYNHLKQQNNRLNSKLLMQKKQKQRLGKQLSLQNEYYNFYERFDLIDNGDNGNVKDSRMRVKCSNKYGFHPVNYMITGIKYRYDRLRSEYDNKCKQVDQILRLTQYTMIQQILEHNNILQKQNNKLMSKIKELSNILIESNINNQVTNNSNSFLLLKQNNNKDENNLGVNNCFKSLKYTKNNINNLEDYNKYIISPQLSQQQHQQQHEQINFQHITNLIKAKNQFQFQYYQLKQHNNKLNIYNSQLISQIESLKLQNKQQINSIKNIHKSLTLLDNQLYHKKKQINKIHKLLKQTQSQMILIQKQSINIKLQCQKQINNNKHITQKMFETQKNIFLKQINQKNQKINKLQKQISYISTLLKYLKPLEQQNNSNHNEIIKTENHQIQQSNVLRMSSVVSKTNRKRTKTKISQHQNNSNQDFKLGLKQPVLSVKQSLCVDDDNSSYQSQQQQQTKQPKTSRKKHSSHGFKVRKINPLELQYLKQQIKYRCLAKRLQMNQIRQLFEAKQHNLQHLNKKQLNWKQKYINMKQLQLILIESPFCLTKDQAYKFSRFIVQDVSAQHVYCDQENQVQREIVKSIIKAFIEDYYLPNLQKCRAQLQSILKEYGKNFKRALDTLSDNGKIQTVKLFGLMESLGLNISEQLKSQIMTRLYQKSQSRSLNTITYLPIFQDNFI